MSSARYARGDHATLLNASLADDIDLMLQAKQAHWNVKSPEFIALRELSGKVVDAAFESVDLLAERRPARCDR